jgi:hypothetical protein
MESQSRFQLPKDQKNSRLSIVVILFATHSITKHFRTKKKVVLFLVAWKDRNMVYYLTNDTSTVEMGECKRRGGQGGIITLKRPEVISKYNQYMGGVNVANMR